MSVQQEVHLEGPLVGIPLQGIQLGAHYLEIPDPHHLQSLLQLGILQEYMKYVKNRLHYLIQYLCLRFSLNSPFLSLAPF